MTAGMDGYQMGTRYTIAIVEWPSLRTTKLTELDAAQVNSKISVGTDCFGSFRWERIAESKCVKSVGPGPHKGVASCLYSGSGFPAPATEVTCW